MLSRASLSRAPNLSSEQEAQEPQERLSEVAAKEVRCRSVMVIDDNDSLREALIATVTAQGYLAFGARDGKMALQTLATLPSPTLIFVDLMMPQMNGWDFCSTIAAQPHLSANPIILMSAVSARPRPDQRAMPKSSGLMQKPVSLKSLIGFVNRHCQKAPAKNPSRDNDLSK